MSDELREAAQRVTGYVRAWQLLSNTDDHLLGEVHVTPAGVGKPMEFRLLTDDLLLLAWYATGPAPIEERAPEFAPTRRCEKRVPDLSGTTQSGTRVCGLQLNDEGLCPLPGREHVRVTS